LGRSSLFAALQHDYGVELAYAEQEIDATAADANLRRNAGIALGAAILRIRQVIYSTKRQSDHLRCGYYRSERHTLSSGVSGVRVQWRTKVAESRQVIQEFCRLDIFWWPDRRSDRRTS